MVYVESGEGARCGGAGGGQRAQGGSVRRALVHVRAGVPLSPVRAKARFAFGVRFRLPGHRPQGGDYHYASSVYRLRGWMGPRVWKSRYHRIYRIFAISVSEDRGTRLPAYNSTAPYSQFRFRRGERLAWGAWSMVHGAAGRPAYSYSVYAGHGHACVSLLFTSVVFIRSMWRSFACTYYASRYTTFHARRHSAPRAATRAAELELPHMSHTGRNTCAAHRHRDRTSDRL